MARLSPTQKTVKHLFALSGNQCAFPTCMNKLVDGRGILIGQICHIEAAEEDGQRFNPKQTDEERRSFENLILLCANHHIETNDIETYKVAVMQKMKADHENNFLDHKIDVSDEIINQAIENYNSCFFQTNIHLGAGVQLNNQGIVQLNYPASANEKEELTLIDELFNSVLSKITESEPIKPSKGHLRLSDKIKLNFKSNAEQKEVATYVNYALLRIKSMEERFQLFYPEEQNDIQNHIYRSYTTLKRSPLQLGNIEILGKLFDEFLPAKRKQDSSYINLAMAFVLFFFDDCTIFEKTETEEGTQYNLFE